MAVSYNNSLVSDFGRHARNMCQSEIYANIWGVDNPGKIPLLSRDSKSVNKFNLQNGSEYIGQGLRGGVTGKGGNVILIDDWIKDYRDLNNRKLSDDFEFYNSTLYNRQERSEEKGDAAIIIIQTHWHKRDLIGQVIDNDDNWEVLKIQAIATKTEYVHKSDLYYYY